MSCKHTGQYMHSKTNHGIPVPILLQYERHLAAKQYMQRKQRNSILHAPRFTLHTADPKSRWATHVMVYSNGILWSSTRGRTSIQRKHRLTLGFNKNFSQLSRSRVEQYCFTLALLSVYTRRALVMTSPGDLLLVMCFSQSRYSICDNSSRV